MKARFMLLAFVALSLFFGCTALDEVTGGGSYSNADYGYSAKAVAAPMVAMESAPAYDSYGEDYAYDEQMVVKQGSVSIDVETGTLEQRKDELSALADQYSAEVSYVWFNEYETEKRYGMTLKIAPSKFDSFMDSLSALGEVRSIDTSLEDVTEQYTDLQTRISNLEEELDRLNALYSEADNVEDVLMIEREVTRVQTDLEIYQGRALDLERRSAKSTVTVYLIEKKPALETDLLLPLGEILNLFFGALSFGIMLVVGIVGFLIPLLVVFFVLRTVHRAFRGRKR
jgi:hypothetical protein